MNQVVLQPTANTGAWKHFVDTIEKSVPISILAKHLNHEQIESIKKIYPNGEVKIWGVTPASDGTNISKWNRLSIGSTTLFARDKKIHTSSLTTYKVHNKNLALELWGSDEDGETWEYIYLVNQVKKHSIPVAKFNEVAGYAPNNNIQGFDVLYEDKSKDVLGSFDFDVVSESKAVAFTVTSFTLVKDDGIEYEMSEKKKREQQSKFRSKLIEAYGKCAITRETATEVLEACHIQPYLNNDSNHIQNGLLLRADLHILFDKGLISIGENYRIWVSPNLNSKFYNSYHGRQIHLPKESQFNPSKKALNYHYKSIYLL